MILDHFKAPTVQQLLATAARLGADISGSTFESLIAIGFNKWIDTADQDHHLTIHCIESDLLSNEDFELRKLYIRRSTLPIFS
jgi:hypothetical protein